MYLPVIKIYNWIVNGFSRTYNKGNKRGEKT
jgi:hypothetical protein